MPKRLTLMFHGDYGDGESLNDRGRQEVDDMALQLLSNGHLPDAIVHSPAVRTTETALRLKDMFLRDAGKDVPLAQAEWLVEGKPPSENQIKDFRDSERSVLLVTHTPNIACLLMTFNRQQEIYDSPDAVPEYASAYVLQDYLAEKWAGFRETRIAAILRPNKPPACYESIPDLAIQT